MGRRQGRDGERQGVDLRPLGRSQEILDRNLGPQVDGVRAAAQRRECRHLQAELVALAARGGKDDAGPSKGCRRGNERGAQERAQHGRRKVLRGDAQAFRGPTISDLPHEGRHELLRETRRAPARELERHQPLCLDGIEAVERLKHRLERARALGGRRVRQLQELLRGERGDLADTIPCVDRGLYEPQALQVLGTVSPRPPGGA
jgi:hypothetical protein